MHPTKYQVAFGLGASQLTRSLLVALVFNLTTVGLLRLGDFWTGKPRMFV